MISIPTSGQINVSRGVSGPNEPEELWWLTASGGADLGHNPTGESIQTTVIAVYYRHKRAQVVYNALESLRDTVVCAGCLELEGYEVVTIPTTTGPFVDQDLDNESRSVGLLQVEITTKKDC